MTRLFEVPAPITIKANNDEVISIGYKTINLFRPNSEILAKSKNHKNLFKSSIHSTQDSNMITISLTQMLKTTGLFKISILRVVGVNDNEVVDEGGDVEQIWF